MLLRKKEFIKHLSKGHHGYILEITGQLNCYKLEDNLLVDTLSGQRFNVADFMEHEYYSLDRDTLEGLNVPACIWYEHQHYTNLIKECY